MQMGLDLRAIPVRLDSEPIRRIRQSPEAWEEACLHPPFTVNDRDDHQPEISAALCAALPGVTGWDQPYPDRSYQVAEFVLDPAAFRATRTWEARERTLAYRIMLGDEPFAEHARGGQGAPWRCSSTAFLNRAAGLIDRVDPVSARREFSLAELDSLGVYKVNRGDDEDATFAGVQARLAGLARYYRDLADRDVDLIIEQD